MGLKRRFSAAAKVLGFARQAGVHRIADLLDIIERQHGHAASYASGSPVDAAGKPLPWYTYPAIEYLSALDFSSESIFEYGSGNSSRFWAERSKRVVSVESDQAWHKIVDAGKARNQVILFHDNKQGYIDAIDEGSGNYDIIVIDGDHRLACAHKAITRFPQNGLIVLDNSDWFVNTARVLRDHGLLQVDFTGLGPVNYYTWTTSLFFARDCRLKPLANLQPKPGIGSYQSPLREE